jgi:predicted NBD/HSP70 family sugar kinase
MIRPAPGSLEALRQRNRDAVLGILRSEGSVSRAEVARLTGLSRSTVSTVVAELIRQEIVRETASSAGVGSGSGRPGTPLTLNLPAGAVLALDLSSHAIAGTVFDLGHRALARATWPFEAKHAPRSQIVDAVCDLSVQLLNLANVTPSAVVGAAMGVPAPVEQETRRVGLQSGIPAIVGDGLEAEISERLGMPFMLENDANLSVLAEWTAGAAEGHSDAIYIEVSEGIGAGLILSGRLHRGAHGTAGEIGHTPIIPDGPVCRCGNRGCLELLAGTGAITDTVSEQLSTRMTIDQIVERARGGDPMCRRILRDAASHIGTVIGSMCNLINPTVVIVGGAFATAWHLIEPALHEALDRSAIHVSIQDLAIVPGIHMDATGRLIGARTLVLGDLERFPGLSAVG